jgi:L-alanine-DL-glutamate epimerase-like enolase superfamily enzyme
VASKHTPNGTSIESVLARTVSVPLDNPTSFSTRSVTARDYTLVRILGEDGVEGIGFCYAGSTGGELVTTAVRELLAPLLVRQDPYRVEGLWQKMYQEALLHGRAGSVMRAISALDIALWDRNARAANLPLYKYLGTFYKDTVPAYASGGYYGEGDPLETLGEARMARKPCSLGPPHPAGSGRCGLMQRHSSSNRSVGYLLLSMRRSVGHHHARRALSRQSL